MTDTPQATPQATKPLIKLASLKADLSREEDGEWIDVAEWPGVALNVRSIHSADYRTARDLLAQRLTRKLGRLPTSVEQDAEMPKLYARHLLRGWRGLDVEYSEAMAAEIITDPDYYKLVEQVLWASTRVGDQDVEFTQAAIKNSAAPSVTT
jgi:hypothetical protein